MNIMTIKARVRYKETEEYIINERTLVGIERDYYDNEMISQRDIDLTDEGFNTIEQFKNSLVRLGYELI